MKIRNYILLFAALVLMLPTVDAQGDDDKKLTRVPDFTFYNAFGNTFDKDDAFEPGNPFVVVYFSTDCEHCQQQATWLAERAGELDYIQFLYVTSSDPTTVPEFDQKYFDGTGLNIKYGLDKDYRIDEFFGYSPVPSMYVFNASGKFLKKFNKEVTVDELLMTLSQ